MTTYNSNKLKKILHLHQLWLNGDPAGVRADFSEADLSGANFSRADLSGANFSEANLSGADFSKADLSGANLDDSQIKLGLSYLSIVNEGTIIGYKRLRDGIAMLEIPKKARRIGGLVGRKCRAEYAKVLSIDANGRKIQQSVDLKTRLTKYVVGKFVRPDSYDPNPLEECSSGIHFFITREEAERFLL